MKRGEVWTAAARGGYVNKPRPVVIVQDDRFDSLDSITVVPFTTDPLDLPLFRIAMAPDRTNGLLVVSFAMADKVTTVLKAKLRRRVGTLANDDLQRLDRALLIFLGLAG